MTYLASLTTGAVMLVRANAAEWQTEILREVTIQIRPGPGRDLDAAVKAAVDIARSFDGISEVRPYTKEESARLLEPWLGSGLAVDELPVPRVIVVKLASGETPDVASLAQDADRQGAGRLARRSPRLDRPHARDGGFRRARRHPGAGAGDRRDDPVGQFRHVGCDGREPAGDRGAAFHRRARPLHCRPVPAPFSVARPEGRCHRRHSPRS